MRILALDIGGTSIKAAAWEEGMLSEIREYDTLAGEGGASVLSRAGDILERMGPCDAIGISTAGQIDSARGLVLYANENIPGYTGIEIGPVLQKRFLVPVVVENDVNAAAIGEGVCGAARRYDSYLCLTYGTGVGGAIVINGELYTGFCGAAGEVGSMMIHGTESPLMDERKGYYEEYASTKALVASVKRIDPAIQNGREVFAAMERPEIGKIIEEWIWEISHGLVTLIHIFNPQCVVLGGGVMNQDYVIERVEKVTKSRVMPLFRNVSFCRAHLGNAAGIWGIIHLTLKRLELE